MMMMIHKEMEVHPLAFLTSPLAGGLVSLIHAGESPSSNCGETRQAP